MVYYDLIEKLLMYQEDNLVCRMNFRIFLINKCIVIDIEKICNVGNVIECSFVVEESGDFDWFSRVWEDYLQSDIGQSD